MRDVHAMAGIIMCAPLIVPLVFIGCCVAALVTPIVMLWNAYCAEPPRVSRALVLKVGNRT
jgi:hypothetical protein